MIHDVEKILFNEADIASCVEEIGAKITKDYEGKEITLVCILKGSMIFTADLARAIKIPAALDFMVASSYGTGTSSSGNVRIIKDLDHSIEGKHVIVVEDIIDSGVTLNYLLKNLSDRNPASLKLCTLLSKPERRIIDVDVDYIGKIVPDYFLVGYGLDYAEKYRNLPFIGILKPSIYK
ncbi:hypoxanthine phosphoribosyltransferase [Anaerosinus massiliensis]|uniref:hypoxanthine phosphoribosyltransferase n=1 Tax=Massilibacillus massiliensis TaxID=1806837 RepID=UPI000AC01042|nr:hypoxanthine phosphoribosyltransferase [Massilibacillus massiliensis]